VQPRHALLGATSATGPDIEGMTSAKLGRLGAQDDLRFRTELIGRCRPITPTPWAQAGEHNKLAARSNTGGPALGHPGGCGRPPGLVTPKWVLARPRAVGGAFRCLGPRGAGTARSSFAMRYVFYADTPQDVVTALKREME
jgi:hypothetical protein